MTGSLELDERIIQAVEQHQKSVIRVAFAQLGSMADAEDVAQEVFLALLRHQPTFANAEHEKAWLLRVAINKARDFARQARRRQSAPLSADIAYLPPEQGDLLQAVLALPEKYRLPLHLFYYEGYTIAEIAQLLSAKAATVGTRLARGRQQLRQQLGGADDEY